MRLHCVNYMNKKGLTEVISVFYIIDGSVFPINRVMVAPQPLPHPNPCIGFYDKYIVPCVFQLDWFEVFIYDGKFVAFYICTLIAIYNK